MTYQLDSIKKIRAFMLEGIKDLTADQLNKIPEGFNNNIAWNLGHMVAAQQGICYKRAGLTPHISEEFYEQFRSGGKPGEPLSDSEIATIKELMIGTINQLEADYNKQIFGDYTAWTTRYEVEMASIDDAIKFLPFHEGLHLGTITALKKLV
jgi:hypothetical protein